MCQKFLHIEIWEEYFFFRSLSHCWWISLINMPTWPRESQLRLVQRNKKELMMKKVVSSLVRQTTMVPVRIWGFGTLGFAEFFFIGKSYKNYVGYFGCVMPSLLVLDLILVQKWQWEEESMALTSNHPLKSSTVSIVKHFPTWKHCNDSLEPLRRTRLSCRELRIPWLYLRPVW